MSSQHPKLLIVEDESDHQVALMDILEANGKDYEVLSAFNGQEALAIAQQEEPDIILTDWEMPQMNGIELIQSLKQRKETADIPIIMCTGIMTDSEHLKIALEAGANDYIRKPFDSIEVIARLSSTLAFRKQQLEKQALEQELWQNKYKVQQEALVVTKAGLLHNNRNIDTILSELNDISHEVSEVCRKKIRTLISKLRADMQQTYWNEIELHFEKTHPEFVNKLKVTYPKLTPNEVELCIYLKLNMSTKEIQSVSYKSADSLKKARQRLKKKLALSKDNSLYVFIQNF